ncbi:Mini-circle protein [Streptomyces cinnamoneus]|uniref:Mini-circle protein n=1 Tax=Streptomyces cinnamoneus TaxID=53446 RepID=A0A2G1XI50_STRCJ|nr:Mini-circle protein [Streptomyces cinnamoneus]PPT16572.1 DinB family protein [Streptomyces cinnamoneus]
MPDGRTIPALTADERTTLESWLAFHRATLAHKCTGLTDDQARTAAAPPSRLSLLGLVQHMTEVERVWFRRVLLKEAVPLVHGPDRTPKRLEDMDETSGGFEVDDDATLAGALAAWRAETATADANAAPLPLDATGEALGKKVSLRWIYVHMIEEYARHNGHADLLRERVDGSAGY